MNVLLAKVHNVPVQLIEVCSLLLNYRLSSQIMFSVWEVNAFTLVKLICSFAFININTSLVDSGFPLYIWSSLVFEEDFII